MSEAEQTYSAKAEVGQVRMRRTAAQRAWIELKKAPILDFPKAAVYNEFGFQVRSIPE